MKLPGPALLALFLLAAPAGAAEADFGQDLAGALRGCEAWVLHPTTWRGGLEPFLAAIGLGERVSSVSAIPDGALPPPELRRGNRFWRITGDKRSGIFLTLSEDVPMCHIVGGGTADLRETIAGYLRSAEFNARWKTEEESRADGLVTVQYRSREEAKFRMTVTRPDDSRADPPGLQILATAIYDIGP